MTKRTPHTRFISLSPPQQREVELLAEVPGWRVVPKEDLPSFFPDPLRQKLDTAIVIASSTMSSNRTYVVCNGIRPDAKADAIDQEPFVVSVLSSGASTGGMLIHHGDWEGRTETPPAGFWETVEESGIGDYFFSSPPSGQTHGTLQDLPTGHKAAFYRAVELLRAGGGST